MNFPTAPLPKTIEPAILDENELIQGGADLEEKYVKVARRQAPSRLREDAWEEPPRRRRTRKKSRGRRSWVVSLGLGLYKVLVICSALVVAAYIGLQLMSRAPEQAEIPNTGQGEDGTIVPVGDSDTGQEDPNALVRRDQVYNILLAGTDAEGYRTDVMMVMCYDTVEQTVGVVSIPRDTITRRESGNVKLVYGSGGVTQRMEDISNMLGIPIDYYVQVDLQGFITLVDYLGGVELDIPLDMNYDDPTPGQELHIHFTKGTHLLSGQEAMEAVRYRHDNYDSPNYDANQWYSDVQRTQLQQQLLTNLAKKVLSWESLTRITGFVEIFNENVETDLSLNEMIWFAQKALGLDPSTAVETQTLEGRGDANYNGQSWCFELDPEKTVETVNRLINPYTRDLTLEDMDILQADSYYFG